jgi:hypothetical protein
MFHSSHVAEDSLQETCVFQQDLMQIWGSHGSEGDDNVLLGWNAM